jgi:predicted N-acyltransferase
MPQLELLDGVAEVAPEAWDALARAAGSPFLEWAWLASLEESGAARPETGWAPRPLVAREGGRLVAACPLYAKGHSEGEFVFDWSWADAAARAGLDYYPKLLAAVPFTPVTGARFLPAPGADRPRLLRALAEGLRELCLANELSGAHVNFCLEDERAALEAAGFLPRLGLQYHWTNPGFRDFDDYLDSLRSKRRNQVRRERRELEAQGVRVECLTGAGIPDALLSRMFDVYAATVRSHPWGREYLNARFFELLAERFRERLCFAVARRGEELVAGAVNVQKDALYGRYWGALRPLRHLHFNVCYYAGVEHCIRAGLPRFEPGAGGEYKQLRGFDAAPTWSCHFLADPRLHEAVGRFLERERAEAGRALEWFAEHTSHRRDDGARLAALRRRLRPPRSATPGART